MLKKNDDLVGTLIHDVAHLLRLDIDRRLKENDLTRVKWLALGIISRTPGLTQSELAMELELGHAATGRLLDRMVQRGFAERQQDENDRRTFRIFITDKALKLLDRLESTADDLRENALQGLDGNEINKLKLGLDKIKKNLKHTNSSALFFIYSASLEFELSIITDFLLVA